MLTVEQAREWGWGERAAAFAAWRNALDRYVQQRIGLSVDDLPDWDFGSAYESGQSHVDAAIDFLAEQGFDGDGDDDDSDTTNIVRTLNEWDIITEEGRRRFPPNNAGSDGGVNPFSPGW